MKKLLILLLLATTFSVTAQTVPQDITVTYFSTGQDSAYVQDSTLYSDGKLVISTSPIMDSASLAKSAIQDSVNADRIYSRANSQFLSRKEKLEEISAQKDLDSLKRSYYEKRRIQYNTVHSSVIAN